MRLNVILIAVAMLLPTIPLFATGAAQAGHSVEFVSPEEGGTLARDGIVSLVYHHASSTFQGRVDGVLLINGTQVANFSRPLNMSNPNGTFISVQVNASGVPGGNQTLVAHLQEAPPSGTPAVNATRRIVLEYPVTPPPPPPPPAPQPERVLILAPGAGGILETRDVVRLAYSRPDARFGSLAGFVTLDGAIVGTFARSFGGTSTNISVAVNASEALLGARTLSAHAWLNDGAPVRAPDVAVEVVPYNEPPRLKIVSANYSNDLEAFVVTGETVDLDGYAASITLLTPFGNHTFSMPPANFTLLVPADPPFGSWPFIADVVDDGGKNSTVHGRLVRVNEPPRLTVTNASHVQGFGYRVSGHVADVDGHVEALQVVIGSRSWVVKNASGDWSLDLADIPMRGLVKGEVITWDDQFARTRVPIAVEVVGIQREIYHETVDTSTGAYANHLPVKVPPRIRAGSIDICGFTCDGTYVGTTILVRHNNGTCSYGVGTQLLNPECRFETGATSSNFSIEWVQATGRATVRISGWEV